MRAEAPAGRRAPRDRDRYVMIEIALSIATERCPFSPFLPLIVRQRRRRSFDDAAPTSCYTAATPNLIPMQPALDPFDRSTRQIAVRP